MARGNGKIFFDAPNRGSKRILAFLNDAPQSRRSETLEDAGNGFLMRQGYTIVWCGWQGDLMPIKNWLVLNVPMATNNGKPDRPQGPRRNRRRRKRRQIAAAQRRRAGEELRSGVPRQSREHHYRTRKILWPKNSGAISRVGLRRLCERSAHRQRNDQAKHQGFLSARRVSSRAIFTNSFIRRKILWCWALASPSCAIWFRFYVTRAKDASGKPNPLAPTSRKCTSRLPLSPVSPPVAGGDKRGGNKLTGVHLRLCLGPLAERPLPARPRLSRLQRRRSAPKSLRRHRAPRGRRRTDCF